MSRFIIVLMLLAVITGCSDSSTTTDNLTVTVEEREFYNHVEAKGQLIAANETVISTPVSSRGPQTLAWLMPEYTQVKKGDVVARFDGQVMERQKRDSEFSKRKVGQDLTEKNTEIDTKKQHLENDMNIVVEEKKFAETFSIDDNRILSRLDIMEQMERVDYLNVKADYFAWQDGEFNQNAEGQIELLNMQTAQHQSKISMLDKNLSQLEVVAPHDGLLTHSLNWRGEKPKAGQTLWPGQKIAGLPDTSVMQLKLFVREREAINLAVDQKVVFTLISDPNTQYEGTIIELAPFPKSIKRQNPQKYYEIKASVDKQGAHLRPGLKLDAEIIADSKSTRLVIPKFSVLSDEVGQYVMRKTASGFERTNVKLGLSNLSHVEVLEGLSIGDVISLVNKEGL